DPQFFGIAPREAAAMDPQQRLLLEVAWEALEDAGQTRERLAGTATGVFVGVCNADWARLAAANGAAHDIHAGTGSSLNLLAGRISYWLDLRGPSLTTDTACSSSLVAVHLACRSLRAGESDLALAGGVNLILSPDGMIVASRMRLFAADGRCKVFDARADGMVRAEGCGVVVLKRFGDALAAGDRVLAVIRGTAVNQDGRTNGITAPNGAAQEAVIRAALADAGREPEAVGYVEAHGTGTVLGDPVELDALRAVFGAGARRCVVGAVKANVGHLEAAAGVAGLIKAVEVVRRGRIPRQVHFQTLNPHIRLEGTRLAIVAEPAQWPAEEAPRVAAVSSFGWSGTNAHVVIEEAPAPEACESEAEGDAAERAVVLPLSARSGEALRTLAGSYAQFLSDPDAPPLADVAYTASVRRTHHEVRLAAVGASPRAVVDALRAHVAGDPYPSLVYGRAEATSRSGVVFVFPGQGSQWVGM